MPDDSAPAAPLAHLSDHHGDRPAPLVVLAGRRPEDLLVAMAAGDEEAMEMFYDLLSARVYGLAFRILRNSAFAEEVAQDAFLGLWRTAADFDPERSSAISWVLTHTHRRCIERVRSSERSGRRDTEYHRNEASPGYDATAETALAGLEAAETVSSVRAALATLSADHRQALQLAYFDGHTHTEISRILGLPLGTAKYRIRAGLQALQAFLTNQATLSPSA